MTDVHNVFTSPSDAVGSDRRLRSRVGLAGDARRITRALAVGVALLAGDVMSTWLALSLTQLAMSEVMPVAQLEANYPQTAALLLIFLALGLYSGSSRSPYARFRARCVAILLFVGLDGFAISGGVAKLVLNAATSAAALLAIGFYTELFIRYILIKRNLWAVPTALVGCGETAQKLFHTLAAEPELGFKPIGFIRTQDDGDVPIASLPAPMLGTIENFAHLVADVEAAILTSRKHLPAANAVSGRLPPTQLILVNNMQDLQTLWFRARTLGSVAGIQFEWDPVLRHNRFLKRFIDLCVAIPASILTFPIVAIFALVVFAVDRGSPFYVQPRVGLRGQKINILKLRTMYRDATGRLEDHLNGSPQAREEWLRYFKLSNDPRILPGIGTFMRRASIDELPQLWGVVAGQLSMVGPRPFPQYHLNGFDAEFQHIRTFVPPGITGLWQVTARSNGDLAAQRALDMTYIRNWSILLDLFILLQTLPAMLTGKGAK